MDMSTAKVPPLRHGRRHRGPESSCEARQSLPGDSLRRPAVDLSDDLPHHLLLHRATLRQTEIQEKLNGRFEHCLFTHCVADV